MYVQTALDRHGFKIYPKYILLAALDLVKKNVQIMCEKIRREYIARIYRSSNLAG